MDLKASALVGGATVHGKGAELARRDSISDTVKEFIFPVSLWLNFRILEIVGKLGLGSIQDLLAMLM